MPLTKSGNPISPASPNALKALFLASRPKTWIASISPVLIGSSLAPHLDVPLFLLTLLFSLFIQIGTNYANDYFDFVNGADTHERKGPKRATQQGWISPNGMWIATLATFSIALLAAIPLMITAGLWSLFLALACVAFGILYTGGPKPLGYLGLGETLVFLFFGPIAACGTYFLQTGSIDIPIFIASLSPGLLSCTILIANNLRDEVTDRSAGKNTLVVRFGPKFGFFEYTATILLASAVPPTLVFFYGAPPTLLTASLIVIPALPLIQKPSLQGSAFLLILYTALFTLFAW